ncbi:endo-alpha-sialidase, phage head domain protein, partial [Escherichia coli FDA504]
GEKRVFLVILFTSFSGSLVSRISGAVQMAHSSPD